MSMYRLKVLNSRGFHLHFARVGIGGILQMGVLPLLAVAGIGGLYLALIHAQTPNCIQLNT